MKIPIDILKIEKDEIQDLVTVVKKLYPWITINYTINRDEEPIHWGNKVYSFMGRIRYEFYFKNLSCDDSNNILLLNDVLQLKPAFFHINENELILEYIF